MTISSIVIEVIRAVFIIFFFFMKDILNVKGTNKNIQVTFNQIFLNKKKHLSNIHSNKYVLKHLKNASMKHLEQKLHVTS